PRRSRPRRRNNRVTLREWFKSSVVALLEAELERERRERAAERLVWAKQLAKAEHRATVAETYARQFAEAVLEKRGVRPISLPPRAARPQPTEQDIGYTGLADAQVRLQALEAEARLRFEHGGAE